MDLAPLEDTLAQNLDDPRFWAIYADALAELEPDSPRAQALQQALASGPATPGAPYEPHMLEVDWHYGHWRAARLHGYSISARTVLKNPHARFLSRLVLCYEPHLDMRDAVVPATLVHLELEQRGVVPSLQLLGPLALQLRELVVREATVEDWVSLPALHRLELSALVALEPRLFPALRELAVRQDLDPDGLDALLASPLGKQLRVLEVSGPGLADHAASELARWTHLERLVVDDELSAQEIPRLHVRRLQIADEEPAGGGCVRFSPPREALPTRLAMERAAQELGLRLVFKGPMEKPGVLLPEEVAVALARTMAAQQGAVVQVVRGFSASEITAWGLERKAKAIPAAWSEPGRAFLADGVEYDTERSELEDGLHVIEEEEEEDDPWGSGPEGEDAQSAEFVGTLGWVWVPDAWRPDPLPHPLRLPHFPRALQPVGADGQPQGPALSLGDALGSYVCWKAFAACLLDEQPEPDVARWTTRLLRRHRIEQEPTGLDHPFWTDWRSVSQTERSGRAPEGRLAAYKLSRPGLWLLDPSEARLLASALRQRVPHHEVPAEHASALVPVLELLSGGPALEVQVR